MIKFKDINYPRRKEKEIITNLPNEIWKDIDDGYKVSNYGRILSLAKTTIRGRKYDKILSASKKDNGYYTVNINGNNEYVHRLVAKAFIDNPNNLNEINHKDEDKSNNRVDNFIIVYMVNLKLVEDMNGLKDSRYNNIRLIFNESEHSYIDTLNNKYISTTQILHQYQPKFDKNYWLRKKSKELGISEKKLEEQWSTITKEACERGTNTHNGLEDGVKGASMFQQAINYLDKREDGVMVTIADIPNFGANYKLLNLKDFIELTDNRYPLIYDAFKMYTERGYKIYSEIGMFLIDWLISGTIDILLVNEDTNCAVVGDWKTNRGGLRFSSGYYKKDKTVKPAQQTNVWVDKDERLLAPLNHLPNCNGAIYNLQLSMYAFAVEYILGLTIKGIWLCHIDSDFELNEYGMPKRFSDGLYHIKENPIETTKFFTMNYLRDDINKVLKDRELQIKASGVQTQFKLAI